MNVPARGQDIGWGGSNHLLSVKGNKIEKEKDF